MKEVNIHTRLGKLINDKKGLVSGPFGSSISKKYFVESGIPVIRGNNLKDPRKKFIDNGFVYITDQKAYELRNCTTVSDDIVFTAVGTLGQIGIIPRNTRFPKYIISNKQIRIRVDNNKVDPYYLYYYFSSEKMRKYIILQNRGSSVPLLNLSDIRQLPVILPPLPTQQKIVSILSAYDDLIENNNKRVALLEEMASELYKEWFVRLRFPNYENSTIVDGIPEGWEKKRLNDLISFYIGGGWGQDEETGKFTEEAYVIRGTDIPKFTKGNLNREVLRYHTESNLSSRAMQEGDIVFEVSGGTESQWLGRSCLLTQKALDRYGKPVMPASFCKLIRADKSVIEPVLLYQFFHRIYYTGEVSIFQVQSTGISNYQFEDFIHSQKVLVPSEVIQTKFKQTIAPMLEEVQVLGEKNNLLQQTRDLLLPRLISGKLQV
ncbi:restriction endonuclease subunit S [Kordia sp. YSTF-M3]|uniref:Restriction endonuclease subunit S n=1 Tax=Kordia aestuariivivens TaxID=2759037 RepID=A0ABR7QD23_9FLAO|nr:restriction endonuclease subunit S [Kordia aestuariivivens]MBC8756427.1 restriction endonuclease subunit S [Kordia aestuariivivens]